MKIHEQKQGAVTILKPIGPLAGQDAPDFKAQTLAALRNTLGRLVVDMSAIAYVDSAGLEVLVDISDEMDRFGQCLKLAGVNKTVREALSLTELAALFEQFDDVNTAIRSFL